MSVYIQASKESCLKRMVRICIIYFALSPTISLSTTVINHRYQTLCLVIVDAFIEHSTIVVNMHWWHFWRVLEPKLTNWIYVYLCYTVANVFKLSWEYWGIYCTILTEIFQIWAENSFAFISLLKQITKIWKGFWWFQKVEIASDIRWYPKCSLL